MTDFFYAIGDFFKSAFRILEKFQNFPNVLFLIVVSVALVIWLRRQAQYNQEAEEKGTYK